MRGQSAAFHIWNDPASFTRPLSPWVGRSRTIAGRLVKGSSLKGAMVSSVMYLLRSTAHSSFCSSSRGGGWRRHWGRCRRHRCAASRVAALGQGLPWDLVKEGPIGRNWSRGQTLPMHAVAWMPILNVGQHSPSCHRDPERRNYIRWIRVQGDGTCELSRTGWPCGVAA